MLHIFFYLLHLKNKLPYIGNITMDFKTFKNFVENFKWLKNLLKKPLKKIKVMVLCELQAVYRALIHQEGTFLSISEINTLISKEHGVILSPHTVVAKIDKLKNTGHIINERIEPKGKNKILTKTFQYISKISQNEHSSNQIND